MATVGDGPAGAKQGEGLSAMPSLRGRRTSSSTRSRLQKVVDSLDLPEDWTVDDFVRTVSATRQRPITLVPLPDSAAVGLCGLWFGRAEDDVILYRFSESIEQQRHNRAHEVAHMLLEHPGDGNLDPAQLATVLDGISMPSLGESEIIHARGFGNYDNKIEYEAELLARMVLATASKTPWLPGERRRDRMLRAF